MKIKFVELGNHKVAFFRFKTDYLVQVFDKNNAIVTFGKATCSEKDTFSRAVGQKVALAKALTGSDVKKSDRRAIWESFRTMKKVPRWNVANSKVEYNRELILEA